MTRARIVCEGILYLVVLVAVVAFAHSSSANGIVGMLKFKGK